MICQFESKGERGIKVQMGHFKLENWKVGIKLPMDTELHVMMSFDHQNKNQNQAKRKGRNKTTACMIGKAQDRCCNSHNAVIQREI